MTIFTIGHSTRSIDEFVALLREAGVDLVVDVRAMPGSRANPRFNAERLADALASSGVAYRHLEALGGRRHGRGDSPNDFWREAGFRGYADYAMGADFRAGLAELEALAGSHTPAVMCAEAVWWRCHRRIIADYLLADGIEVRHILGPGNIEAARMTPNARREGGVLVYRRDAGDAGPLFRGSQNGA